MTEDKHEAWDYFKASFWLVFFLTLVLETTKLDKEPTWFIVVILISTLGIGMAALYSLKKVFTTKY